MLYVTAETIDTRKDTIQRGQATFVAASTRGVNAVIKDKESEGIFYRNVKCAEYHLSDANVKAGIATMLNGIDEKYKAETEKAILKALDTACMLKRV